MDQGKTLKVRGTIESRGAMVVLTILSQPSPGRIGEVCPSRTACTLLKSNARSLR